MGHYRDYAKEDRQRARAERDRSNLIEALNTMIEKEALSEALADIIEHFEFPRMLRDRIMRKAADKLPPVPSSRDWVEDFAHENGNYLCRCDECKQFFWGHKRRFMCKRCAAEEED